jgi:vacuolar-type H+-ATPase subunit I/STV1
VDLYIHSPIRLHGVVLNYLSTGTIVPLPVYILIVSSHLCIVLENGLHLAEFSTSIFNHLSFPSWWRIYILCLN